MVTSDATKNLFLTAAFLGRTIKMIAVAYAGACSLTFVRELIQRM
jgi:hypothetical protein